MSAKRLSQLCGLALLTACHVEPTLPVVRPAAPSAPAAVAPTHRRTQPLVVLLVVDQLALWEAVERWQKLPATGGFAKLLAESNERAELRFGHAYNATGPGHAALFSGACAHDSGITSNRTLDESGKRQSPLLDRETKLTGPLGALDRPGVSLRTLKVPTIADVLREQRPNAIVIALSMKDRGAVFAAGRKPDAALWFDSQTDAFVSSTSFTQVASFAWAEPFTKPGAGAAYRSGAWVPLDLKWLATHTDLPAPDLGQGDFHGLGKRFPHDFANTHTAAEAFIATPFADRMLLDLAAQAAVANHDTDVPTLLSVSLSATDYVGHTFGPDSPEAWDQLLALDAALGGFLKKLDETFEPGGYSLILSSDHGVGSTPEVMNQGFCGVPGPERFERRCERALRLNDYDLAKIAETAADKAVGEGDWILGGADPFIVFTKAARELTPKKRDQLTDAVAKALSKVAGIARVVDVRMSAKTCPEPADESLDALVCRSIDGDNGGDLYILTKPGVFFDAGYVEGDGVNHGSPYLFDRSVPIVVRRAREAAIAAPAAPSFDPKQRVDQRAFAVTAAALLSIAPPPAARGGRDLSGNNP